MFVMEPADEENKDHSHVAHKMKHKHMKFEDSNGIVLQFASTQPHAFYYILLQLFIYHTLVFMIRLNY